MIKKGILKKIKKDYSTISNEFDTTRQHPWPEFSVFLKYAQRHSVIYRPDRQIYGKIAHRLPAFAEDDKVIKLLDIGCGNGRLFDFLKNESNIEYLGIDNNRILLKIAKKNHPEATFRYGDILKLLFPTSSFDTVWCIAVLHHLPTKKLQFKAIKEMRRVLGKNGSLMLTVWNLWQPKYRKYINKKTNDAEIPWGQKKKVKRYYHAFTRKELEELLQRAGFSKLKIIRSERNFAYICEK